MEELLDQRFDVCPDVNGVCSSVTPTIDESSSYENSSIAEEDDSRSMHHLLGLPNEILQCILCQMDMPTLCSVSQTCQRLYSLQSSEVVWREAFYSRYPRLAMANHRAELETALGHVERSWRRLSAWRSSLGAVVRSTLDQMGDKYYTVGGLPDPAMQEMRQLVTEHGTLLIKDELLEILDTELIDSREHISRRYYARMLYRELHRDMVLLPLFREFMQRPVHHMNIPEALHLIDLWMTPEKRHRQDSELKCHYVRIANMVLSEIRSACPDHPLAGWRACKPDPYGRTLWPDRDVPAVLDAVNAVLYGQLGLLSDNDGKPWQGYSAVAHELFCYHDQSTPAVLSALYATVSGMLGVNLHPVQFPGNYLLRWHNMDGSDCVFVDVMRAGLRQTREDIMRNPYMRLRNVETEWFEPIPRQQLLNRLVAGVARSPHSPHLTDADLLSLNALSVWSESDCRLEYQVLYGLTQVFGGIRPMYIHRLIDEFLQTFGPTLSEEDREGLQDSMQLMNQRYQRILRELERHQEVLSVRRDSASVQRRFSVGDIVRHRKYDYLATVTGWTAQCHASETWIEQMGVDLLPRGRHQPFFHVLVEDGSNRYAADENLERAAEPLPIGHREIGRYFLRYDGRRYVPLPALAERYPSPAESAERADQAAETEDGAEPEAGPPAAAVEEEEEDDEVGEDDQEEGREEDPDPGGGAAGPDGAAADWSGEAASDGAGPP